MHVISNLYPVQSRSCGKVSGSSMKLVHIVIHCSTTGSLRFGGGALFSGCCGSTGSR